MGHMPIQKSNKFMSTIRGIRLEDLSLEGENKKEAKEKNNEDNKKEDEEKDEVFTSILQYVYRYRPSNRQQ
ncbi:hypothetical protein CIB48_g5593 [Xylaria polymorpha]|nr:hypothetical protein CIB48_g5593 [Xylaria polymorpha]